MCAETTFSLKEVGLVCACVHLCQNRNRLGVMLEVGVIETSIPACGSNEPEDKQWQA